MRKGAVKPQQRSITFTVLIGTYIVTILTGLCLAALGFAGHVELSVSPTSLKISTGNIGLALVVFGGFMAGLVTLKLPKGVQVFAPTTKPSPFEVFARKAGLPLFALGMLALAIMLFLLTR